MTCGDWHTAWKGQSLAWNLHCVPQTYLLTSSVQRKQLEAPSPEAWQHSQCLTPGTSTPPQTPGPSHGLFLPGMPFQPLTLRTPIYSSLRIQTNVSWNAGSNKTDPHFWASVFSSARWAANSSSAGLQGEANGSPVEQHQSLQPFGSPHHSCAKKTVIPPWVPSGSHCQAHLAPISSMVEGYPRGRRCRGPWIPWPVQMPNIRWWGGLQGGPEAPLSP